MLILNITYLHINKLYRHSSLRTRVLQKTHGHRPSNDLPSLPSVLYLDRGIVTNFTVRVYITKTDAIFKGEKVQNNEL